MVPPYYNRPNQEGIFRHFEAIVAACDLPIVLYNVPGRTVTDIAVETIGKLAHAFPSIVGIKDATGAIARVSAQRAAAGPDFCQLSRSEEHTSELQSLMRISYAVFCLKKKNTNTSNYYLSIRHTTM